MQNKKLTLALAVALLVSFSLSTHVFAADTPSLSLKKDIESILSATAKNDGFPSVNEWLDSASLSEWYAFALSRYDTSLDFSAYKDGFMQKYSTGSQKYSPVEYHRMALPLLFSGFEKEASEVADLDNTVGKGGIMSYVYGLHLLNCGIESENFTATSVIDSILSLRLPDGGWAVSGAYSNVDVTAMTLQALAPHRERADVSVAIDSALSFLSSSQLQSGGFVSYGEENPESAAQVIILLTSLGRDPLSDPDFIKDRNLLAAIEDFNLGDSYCHVKGGSKNLMATSQVLLAKIALLRYYEGRSPIYIFDENKTSDFTDSTEKETDNVTSDSGKVTESIDDKTDTLPEKEKGSYKPTAIIVTVATAFFISAILFLLGKRSYKNFAVVFVIAALVILFIIFVDISSPEDYYGTSETKGLVIGYATVSVDASEITELDEKGLVPEDGIILPPLTLPIEEGDTVYDLTVEAARIKGLNFETASGSSYVRGIAHIYEFDFGSLAGWTYTVNGKTPSVGCSEYVPKDGDIIVWHYVLEPKKFD